MNLKQKVFRYLTGKTRLVDKSAGVNPKTETRQMDNGAQKGVHEKEDKKDKRWAADALAGIQADSDTTRGARRTTIGSR